ncbi:hypothetical protein VTN49DRAFT_6748 [Thermomyces lanuginosus]|uniref:uncharacterized protein n=1 Tax=Thermomyces lanuginosus TaxID=5541 RepID=UPI003741E8DF
MIRMNRLGLRIACNAARGTCYRSPRVVATSRPLLGRFNATSVSAQRRLFSSSERRVGSGAEPQEEEAGLYTTRKVSSNEHETLEWFLRTRQIQVDLPGIERFPLFWLRDNCQCSQCIHPETHQRTVDTFSIPEDIEVEDIKFEESTITIKWSDGHTGVYPRAWLKAHIFPEAVKRWNGRGYSLRPFESVPSNYKSLPAVSFNDVMNKEESVLEWLEKIIKYGFCTVTDVPANPESTKALLERIAFIRVTHYGGFWDFTSDLTVKDTAYTSEALGAHTDNTYFTDPSRLQLLHLLSHTEGSGGATILVDGFKAAEILQNEDPFHAETLARLHQPWHASGNEDVCIQPGLTFPVLNRDPVSGVLYQVRWNNYDRAAGVDSLARQMNWYAAARHWNEIIHRPDMEIWMQMQPGTALIFDNWRMMHGRSEFTGKRRLCGGYINGDDFASRYRLLKWGRETTLNTLGTPGTQHRIF